MAKLKVGLVLDDTLDTPDGVQQYVLTVGRWLTTQGHEVHYLMGETTRTDIPNLHSLSRNVRVRFNQNRMAIPLPASRAVIRELLAHEQFDVLHVQMPYSPFLAGRIVRAAGPRTAVVGTFHIAPSSWLVTAGNRLLRLLVSRSLPRFDVMMGAPAAAAFARRTFGSACTVVPLPLALARFYHGKPFSQYAAGQTVVFLGRLVERKGCQYLLQAVAAAQAEGTWPPAARVLICGTGPLQPMLETYASRHGLNEIVNFAGYISEDDKPRYLASADVVVYPSTGGESFGVVLLEAMAGAKGPVLAGDNPGYASVLGERPAQLFDPRNVSGLAQKIIAALADGPARQQAAAWQHGFVRRFDVDTVGPQIVAAYNQALHKRAG